MSTVRRHEVMMAGIGGKGILMIGRLLGECGMSKYKNVTYFDNYGAEMRGGDSEVTVILSDDPISSQVVFHPQTVLIMDTHFFKPMEARMKPGGKIFVDSTVVPTRAERADLSVYYLPVTQKAQEMGNTQVANIILLGAYLEADGAVTIGDVERALEKRMLGTRREALLQLDKDALHEGAKMIAEYAPAA